MSSSLECYAVDVERLWSAFGSNNGELVAAILSDCAEEVSAFDEDTPDKAPPCEEMLKAYASGEAPHMAWVGWNWRLLQILCEHLGESVGAGDVWSRVNSEFVDYIGSTLATAGAPFRLSDLLTSGPPKNIPLRNPHRPGSEADCGFVTGPRVREFAAWTKRLRVEDLGLDDFGADGVVELKEWFESATERGSGLALFYG